MFKNVCVGLLVSSFIFSASSVKADDFDTQDGIDLAKGIVDIVTNGGKGWGPNPGGGGGGGWPGGGGGGWPGGGGGGVVRTPNGTPVYAGQTVYENGYKYWRCGNPSCYKLHSQFVGGGGGGGWPGGGGGGGWPGGGVSPTYSLGVTIKSIGNGVTITGFNQSYNRYRLDIGDRIIAARLPSGQIVPINTISDLRKAKSISGPTGQLQVRVRKTNGFVLYKTLTLAGGVMSAESVYP